MGILDKISSPKDVKNLDLFSLKELAHELREEIIHTVSQRGGHLAPSLGVVELTLALLKVFDPDKDKIIWDVGHQCYAYKILTRGVEKFRTLRQLGGISGFPKISESKYDHFGVGHSSTSISAALGFVVARDLKNEDFKVIAVIGDGSIAAGQAFEAMNNAGHLEKDIIVILNDNEMSISKSVGALSSFLSRKLSKRTFVKLKEEVKHLIQRLPYGEDLLKYAKRGEESLKALLTPGILFEALKFHYLGPIDGHNLKQLIQILEHVKHIKGPVLVHTLTKKGKGFKPAEDNPTLFHGIGPFDPKTGEIKKRDKLSYSKVLGKTLCKLAQKDEKIIAITAAMPEGTGLSEFKDIYPERFFDVGICEQHAVTFAASLALQGFKPVVCIYSTFLQRAYDQIIHDVCLQDLNVTFCIDRAGLVGEDGPTHHGQFDVSYLRPIPNMVVMAPKDEQELQRMLKTAIDYPHPTAIRYPRGSGPGKEIFENIEDILPIEIGKAEIITQGDYGLVLALGNTVNTCKEAVEEERKEGRNWTLLNVRFVKPLPEEDIFFWIENKGLKNVVIVEENALMGGFGSAVLEFLCEKGYTKELKIKRIGIPDRFIEHGRPEELRKLIGLDKENIIKALRAL